MLKRYDFESLLEKSAAGGKIKVIPFSNLFEPQNKNEPKEPEKKFTDEDLENAKKESYQNGFSSGLSEGQTIGKGERIVIEQNIDSSLKTITSKIDEIFSAVEKQKDHLTKTFTKLSFDIAKKIAGNAIKENPTEKIEQAFKDTINLLGQEIKISIFVNTSQKADIEAKIGQIVATTEHVGKVSIKADDNIAQNDCRIEWEGGSLDLNNQKVIDDINTILLKFDEKNTQ